MTLFRNILAIAVGTSALAFLLWHIESEKDVSLTGAILLYTGFGVGCSFLLAGKLWLRLVLLFLVPLLAALALEGLGFGDAAYPFIGVLFAMPISGIFLLAGISVALLQRAYNRKLTANAS
jgi:hypothetical protein